MNEEKWENMECGCVTNGKTRFNIGEVNFFAKFKVNDSEGKEQWGITLGIGAGIHNISWNDEQSRNNIWDMFMKLKDECCKFRLQEGDRARATSQAHLLLQGKMTEKILGHDHNV